MTPRVFALKEIHFLVLLCPIYYQGLLGGFQ